MYNGKVVKALLAAKADLRSDHLGVCFHDFCFPFA